MSWKYPKHRIKPADVVEIDDLNRDFSTFSEELDGGLNEHNWAKDSFTRLDCADDVSIECWKTYQRQDPWAPVNSSSEFSLVRASQAWEIIQSTNQTCQISATTSKSILWIIANVQHQQQSDSLFAQYALRVDGTIIPETITGSSALGSDMNQNPIILSTTNNYDNYKILGSGIADFARSISLDTMVPVGPGVHTVDLVSRTMPRASGSTHMRAYNGARELIVLSLKK